MLQLHLLKIGCVFTAAIHCNFNWNQKESSEHISNDDSKAHTNSLSKTVFSVKPLFERFKRFEKSLYKLKRLSFESELVSS